jgi:riboflavin transporter FmnP
MPSMTRARLDGMLLLLFGSVLFVLSGCVWERISPISMADFKPLYYASRCLLQHRDPYSQSQLQQLYFAEGEDTPGRKLLLRNIVTWSINTPATYAFVAPIAMLPWRTGHLLWVILTGTGFILAAVLIWDLGSAFAPIASGALLCMFLAGQGLLLGVGNAAGIVVSLCIIAVWCFLRERFVSAGILCLAVSLAIKPHDSGMVWLFFLLAGGLYRKRALQTLALTVILTLPAVVWMTRVSPHWMQEMRANLITTSALGGNNDPAGRSADPRFPGAVTVHLHSAISVFSPDPRIYTPVTYLICAPLLLLWVVATLRSRISPARAWLALASIAPLSMLPIYHRQHDASLLLLTVPACATLWAEGGATAWLALLFTGTAAVIVSNITLQVVALLSAPLWESANGLRRDLLTLLFDRPAPLILLVVGIFYLSVYSRRCFGPSEAAIPQVPSETLSAPRCLTGDAFS